MARHLAHQVLADHSGVTTCSPKLTEGTVSTDLLVVYTPFPFFWTQHIWDRGAGPKAQTGALTSSKKGTKQCA